MSWLHATNAKRPAVFSDLLSELQLDLFYDYRNNVTLYLNWQEFLRKQQPKTIIFWGQGDIFFTPEGALRP